MRTQLYSREQILAKLPRNELGHVQINGLRCPICDTGIDMMAFLYDECIYDGSPLRHNSSADHGYEPGCGKIFLLSLNEDGMAFWTISEYARAKEYRDSQQATSSGIVSLRFEL